MQRVPCRESREVVLDSQDWGGLRFSVESAAGHSVQQLPFELQRESLRASLENVTYWQRVKEGPPSPKRSTSPVLPPPEKHHRTGEEEVNLRIALTELRLEEAQRRALDLRQTSLKTYATKLEQQLGTHRQLIRGLANAVANQR